MIVQDYLVNPVNEPLQYAKIQFKAIKTSPKVIVNTTTVVTTNAEGYFNVNLLENTYKVYITQSDIEIAYPVGYILDTVFTDTSEAIRLTDIIVEELPDGTTD